MSPQWRDRLWLLPVALASLLGAALSLREIADGDTGWHLALGRLIAAHGVESRNALSWTAPDYPWYPTSWLYDLVAYHLMSRFGPGGVQLITLTCVMLTLSAVALTCRRIGTRESAGVVLALSLLMLPRIVARPHVVSWVVLAWTLALCWRGSWRSRAAAILVIAAGSNFHSGAAFASGVIGLFCLEAAIEEGAWWREGVIAAGSVIALTANPGGLANLRYLVENLHANSVLPIVEMMPATPSRDPYFFVMLALTAASVALVRRHWANVAAAAVFALLALKAQRFVFEFYILSAPLLTAAAVWMRERRPALSLAFAGALIVLGGAYGRVAFDQYRFGPWFDLHGLPLRAIRFIQAEHLEGRLFNSYHDGGQLAWSLPAQSVYLDGRLQAYPPAMIEGELAAERSPEAFRAYVRQLGVEWAITGAYGHVLTGERLLDAPDWALVYWDEVNEIFLRRDVPRFADVIARNEYHYFSRAKDPGQTVARTLADATPEVLRAYEAELDRYELSSPGQYVPLLARCIIATRESRSDAARLCSRADLARN